MARPNSIFSSQPYRQARARVAEFIRNPSKLMGLSSRVQRIVSSGRLSNFADLLEALKTAVRLVRCYAQGTYRDVSLKSLVLIVTSFLYLVMPFDLIPDFMLVLGLTDDAALLLWTLNSVMDDLEHFAQWEASQADAADSSPPRDPIDA